MSCPPKLSIILVNYRVPHFLEQCLHSIEKATVGIDAEVIVVDNDSGDGSIEELSPRFPTVRFIASDQNLGFARASNWGYRESSGAYVLFLNPDTLLSEDSLSGPLQYLDARPQAGALGIRMIDGNGVFLPESKRAFPDPLTAFYKMTGLSKLFPRSPRFARYHLGHLPNDRNHPIDVVSGAFFMVRRSVLEKVGSFDEQFFMYGEDIDLSYRIQQAGFENQYFADAVILHFKGESTQKQSIRYVKLFYGAMSLFVRKHRLQAGWFRAGMQVAIGLRAFLSLFRRGIQKIGIPTFDALFVLLVFGAVAKGWTEWIRPEVNYPSISQLLIPLQALVFCVASFLGGLYRPPFRWLRFFRSTFLAAGVVLAIYSLLPESFRYSRGMVAFGSVFSIGVLAIWRNVLLYLQLLSRSTAETIAFPALVIGTENARRSMMTFYPDTPSTFFLLMEPDTSLAKMEHRIRALSATIDFSHIVFCVDDLSFRQIFSLMMSWGSRFSYHFYTVRARTILPLRKG